MTKDLTFGTIFTRNNIESVSSLTQVIVMLIMLFCYLTFRW